MLLLVYGLVLPGGDRRNIVLLKNSPVHSTVRPRSVILVPLPKVCPSSGNCLVKATFSSFLKCFLLS